MKKKYKIFVLFIVAIGLSSCDDKEHFELLPKEETFEIITPTNGSTVVLDDTNLSNIALFISWSVISGKEGSTYNIEIAEAGTEFETPFLLGTSDSNSFSMTVDELNTFLLDVMSINADEANKMEIKVSSSSEVTKAITVLFTPFTVEFEELFLVGSITDPQWIPAEALPMTRLDLNLFEITVDLVDGDEFKFLPTNIDFEGDLGEDPNNAGNLIKDGEQNFSGYPAGKYTITVDLNTFTFVIKELLAPEELFLVGSLTGWDPVTSWPFFNSAENVFTIVADLPDGAEFKFLPQNTGWDGDWGEDPNNSGSIIQDGEQNVSGYSAGKYLITVDYNTLTYKLSSIDNLFLVGSLTGWDPGTSLSMGEASLGVFSTIIDLPDGAEFKFLPQNTGWDGDWGEDPDNSRNIIQDGEQNLSGFAAGKYVVAVDFNTLTYSVSGVSETPSNLYLVGAFNGWSNDTSNPQFTETSTGIFEINQVLSANDEFKFVPIAGDWGNDWGESNIYKSVLEQSSEQNVKVADAGTYTIIVNFNDGTIKVN
ncbi:MAG: SusF/SusE family outer membrane protein [Flavobacteriaceae bacterium]|nr:SusF/SusE family outer membrane protein [Flavobacteriaceae bacterium]